MAIDTSLGLQYGDTAASSYYTNILQDMFLPAMADAVIYPNTLLKRLPRSSRHVEGKLVKYPVHYDDATGVSAIAASGLLPDPDTEKFAQYAFDIRHLYVRLKFDGISKDATNTRIASWLNVLMYESEAKAKVMARARQRIFHNDGSGRLAEYASSSGFTVGQAYAAAGVITPRINQGIESPATCTTSPMRWIKVGMILAFVAASGTAPTTGTIKAVAAVTAVTATTFTIGTPLSVSGVSAVGDYIVTASQVIAGLTLQSTAYRKEFMGIAGILSDADPDDGTAGGFQGIDSDTITWLRATVLANSAVLRPVTAALIDLGWTTAIEIGDSTPSVMVSSFPGVRAIAQALLVDRRFVGTKTYDAGYEAITYNNVPIIADRDMYNNRLALLDETDLSMNVLADPQWMDMDGAVYSRLQEKDEYQATMFMREQLSSDMRKKHVLITDLQE